MAFLRGLLEFLFAGSAARGVVVVFKDNNGAVKLASDPICTNRTKHTDVRCHHVREKVNQKFIKAVHVSCADQSADGITKNLPGEALLVKHRPRSFLIGWHGLCFIEGTRQERVS